MKQCRYQLLLTENDKELNIIGSTLYDIESSQIGVRKGKGPVALSFNKAYLLGVIVPAILKVLFHNQFLPFPRGVSIIISLTISFRIALFFYNLHIDEVNQYKLKYKSFNKEEKKILLKKIIKQYNYVKKMCAFLIIFGAGGGAIFLYSLPTINRFLGSIFVNSIVIVLILCSNLPQRSKVLKELKLKFNDRDSL